MCGITGILNTDGKPVDQAALERMTNRLAHRGPDGGDVYIDGAVGLGHRRLAIIDLEGGKQPISNEDGTIWLTFNGEIYNFRELRKELEKIGHRFRTHSDSEIIVHAYETWGSECLGRLRGMFGFGIWDAKKKLLFVARDRIGIKPVCYYSGKDVFAFASEIQSLWELPAFDSTMDLNALDLYLHLQYIPAPHSIFRSIRKLPPAHYMIVNADGATEGPKRYWDLRFHPDRSLSENQWVERLDAALHDAVASHLVSDVPFGAFLSGGVDSSAVAAYMAESLETPVHTFTIGYDDANYDEREFAATASRALGTVHTEKVVYPDAMAILPKLAAHYGEPFGDSSAVCTYYVAQAAREHVKMVLSGDGGDETHAGYEYFAKMLLHYPQPKTPLERARRMIGALLCRIGVRRPLPALQDAWYQRSPYFGDLHRKKLWKQGFQSLIADTKAWNKDQFRPVAGSDVLSQCQYVDIHTYLTYDNLCKVDIATMAHGLEVRVPLLDHVLLETVAAIPPELKVKLQVGTTLRNFDYTKACGKYLLKKTTERFFPSDFYNRRKLGFSMPIDSWLAGPLYDETRDKILDSKADLSQWFNMDYIHRLLDEHRTQQIHGGRIWLLLFLAQWRMLFKGL